MFFLLIIVLIVQKLIYKETIIRPLLLKGRPNKWWPFAMVLPLLFVGLTALVASLIPGATLDLGMENYLSTVDATTVAVMDDLFQTHPFHPIWSLAGQSMIGGLTINAISAFGEEIGWHGVVLGDFQ